MQPSARVLADSYYGPENVAWVNEVEHRTMPPWHELRWAHRVTTLEVVMHRFVLAEFNTHRVFSRNSASSRAIPFDKQMSRVVNDPAIPLSFPAEQRGMQGGDELEGPQRTHAVGAWLEARDNAVELASDLHSIGVHKSVVNRLLEPFMWHTVIVTSTEWENFFTQRCSPLAQPEIRAAAEAMREVYEVSTPEPLEEGHWHLPLLDGVTILEVTSQEPAAEELLCQISAARCARVSYLTHDGKRDWHEDLALFERLTSAKPAHWSPLEHVCRRPYLGEAGIVIPGNLQGFVQLRHLVSGEFKECP